MASQHRCTTPHLDTASRLYHLAAPHGTAPHRTAPHLATFQAIRAIDTALKLLPENVSESTGIKRHRDNYQTRVDKLT